MSVPPIWIIFSGSEFLLHIVHLSLLAARCVHIYSYNSSPSWNINISRSTTTTHNMKVSSSLPLFYCLEILGVLLCGLQSVWSNHLNSNGQVTSTQTISTANPISINSNASNANNLMNSETTGTQQASENYVSTTPAPTVYMKECFHVLLVAGGLIIGCFILLVSTFLLLCMVCNMNRRIKMLSNNGDLIGSSEYRMRNATMDQSKTEAEETTVLMADIIQTLEEVGNDTTREEEKEEEEEEEKPIEEEQTGEENKEAGNAANNEEAPAN